jgi:hypothetical protein
MIYFLYNPDSDTFYSTNLPSRRGILTFTDKAIAEQFVKEQTLPNNVEVRLMDDIDVFDKIIRAYKETNDCLAIYRGKDGEIAHFSYVPLNDIDKEWLAEGQHKFKGIKK